MRLPTFKSLSNIACNTQAHHFHPYPITAPMLATKPLQPNNIHRQSPVGACNAFHSANQNTEFATITILWRFGWRPEAARPEVQKSTGFCLIFKSSRRKFGVLAFRHRDNYWPDAKLTGSNCLVWLVVGFCSLSDLCTVPLWGEALFVVYMKNVYYFNGFGEQRFLNGMRRCLIIENSLKRRNELNKWSGTCTARRIECHPNKYSQYEKSTMSSILNANTTTTTATKKGIIEKNNKTEV